MSIPHSSHAAPSQQRPGHRSDVDAAHMHVAGQDKVAYSAEEATFHKTFPEVPLSEKLVESYQCGLTRNKVVSMGRLYLTSLRVCFYAAFPRKIMNVEWDAVRGVEKKSNFLFEAVVVTSLSGERYHFSAFMFGQSESAQRLMGTLWSVRSTYGGSTGAGGAGGGGPVAVPGKVAENAAPPAAEESTPSVAATATDGAAAGRGGDGAEGATSSAAQQSATQSSVTSRKEAESAPLVLQCDVGSASLGDTEGHEGDAAGPENAGDDAGAEDEDADDVPSSQEGGEGVVEKDPCAATIGPASSPLKPSQSQSSVDCGSDGAPRTPHNTVASGAASAVASPASVGGGSHPVSGNPSFAAESLDAVEKRAPDGTASRHRRSPRGSYLDDQLLQASTSSEPPLHRAATPPPPPLAPATEGSKPTTAVSTVELPRVSRTRTPAAAPADGDNAGGVVGAQQRQQHQSAKHHNILAHFPAVPPGETVIDSFQCSYISGVHRLGKLHITTNFILFTSVMFAEGVCIKFSDVKAAEKQTSMVVFEGISITTKAGKIFDFTSFANRDSAFRIIQQLHAAHAGKMQLHENRRSQLPPTQHQAPADHLQEPQQENQTTAAAAAAPSQSHGDEAKEGVASPRPTSDPASPSDEPNGGFEFVTSTSQPHFDSFPSSSGIADFDKYGTDFGTGISPTTDMLQRVIVDDVALPPGRTVIDVFKNVFDDDTRFLDSYHEARRESGMEWEQWRPCLGGAAQHAANNGQRLMRCKTIIRAMFQTTCDFTEFSKYAFLIIDNKPTLLVHFSGQAVGVPQSDTFRAETLLVFTQQTGKGAGPEARVSARVYGHVQFTKTCWVKSKVLKTALSDEMPASYRLLLDMVREHLLKIPASGVGMRAPAPRAVADAELHKKALHALDPMRPPTATAGVPNASMDRVADVEAQLLRGTTVVPSRAPSAIFAAPPDALLALPAGGPFLHTVRAATIGGCWWAAWGLWGAFWFSPTGGSDSDGEAADTLPAAVTAFVRPLALAVLCLLLVIFACIGDQLVRTR